MERLSEIRVLSYIDLFHDYCEIDLLSAEALESETLHSQKMTGK
jgi:hypothetical protein